MSAPTHSSFSEGGKTSSLHPPGKGVGFGSLHAPSSQEDQGTWAARIMEHGWKQLPGPRWIWWAVGVGVVIFWGLVDVRLRGFPWTDQPREHKTDFTVYTAAGRAFFTGENPYEVTNPRGWKYVYPPMFALLVAPLSLLPMPEQCLVWYGISVLLCWGCYRELVRIVAKLRGQEPFVASRYREWFPRLGVLAFGAALLPTLNCLQRGQVGVLKLYLLLLGIRLIWDSKGAMGQVLGGVAMAGSLVLKLTPSFVVGVFLWAQLAEWVHWLVRAASLKTASRKSSPSPRFLCETEEGEIADHLQKAGRNFLTTAGGVGLGLILLVLVVPGCLLGWKANLEHLAYWYHRVVKAAGESVAIPDAPAGGSENKLDRNAFGGNHRTVRNQSLANAIFRVAAFVDYMFLGGPYDRLLDDDCAPPTRIDTPLYQRIQKTARAVVLVAILLASWVLGTSGGMLSQAAAFGLGCVGMLAISPLSWGHYFLFLSPGVLFVPLWLARAGWARTASFPAGLPAVLSLAHYLFLFQVGRIGLLGLGTTLWLLVASGAILVATVRPQRLSASKKEGTVPGDLPTPAEEELLLQS